MQAEQSKLNILIVEDELIIGAHISQVLTSHGHTVLDIIRKGEEVPGFIAKNKAELVIMDINLAGQLDGIETAKIISETEKIPIIFLTANVDDDTFEKSKKAFPYAFIGKPFKPEELLRTIDLVIARMHQAYSIDTEKQEPEAEAKSASDSIFIKDKNKMVKVKLSDVMYIEAERNYSKIHTSKKVYLLSSPLKSVESKINSDIMQRVHRSYLVNTELIDELDDSYVFISGKSIPVSKSFKKELNKKLRLI